MTEVNSLDKVSPIKQKRSDYMRKNIIKFLILLLIIGGIAYLAYYIGQNEISIGGNPSENGNNTEDVLVDHQYYDQTAKSVVRIHVAFSKNDSTAHVTGSAVIIYADDVFYYAVTNYHVLVKTGYESTSIQVIDYLNNEYEATSLVNSQILEIASDAYDLALIRFEKGMAIPSVEYSNLTLTEGSQVHSVGYPGGVRTLTTGEMRGFIKVLKYPFQVIEHSSEINKGSSGGALLDRNGRLIGINASVLLSSNDAFLTGYAIPIEKVLEYIDLFNINMEDGL